MYLNRTNDIRLLQVPLATLLKKCQQILRPRRLREFDKSRSRAPIQSVSMAGTARPTEAQKRRPVVSECCPVLGIRQGTQRRLARSRGCFRLILVELVVERLEGDPEFGRRLGLIASVTLERR